MFFEEPFHFGPLDLVEIQKVEDIVVGEFQFFGIHNRHLHHTKPIHPDKTFCVVFHNPARKTATVDTGSG